MASVNVSSDAGNWFIHVVWDKDDPIDPEKWVFTIDHSWHANLQPNEAQFCLRQDPTGGFPTAREVGEKMKEVLVALRTFTGMVTGIVVDIGANLQNPGEKLKQVLDLLKAS